MISADLCWEEGEIFDKIVMVFRSSEIRLQLKKLFVENYVLYTCSDSHNALSSIFQLICCLYGFVLGFIYFCFLIWKSSEEQCYWRARYVKDLFY